MAAGDRTAVFRAIGDFSRLVRDAKRAKTEMRGLGDESERTAKGLDRTGDSTDKTDAKMSRFARTMGGLSKALQGPQKAMDRVKGSKFGEFLQGLSQHGEKLSGHLGTLRNKLVVFAGMATAATAAIGPVAGLVGAVASLSGVAGVVPGAMLAMGAASAVLKVAFLGVDDVMKSLGGTAEEFDAAIKDLPPSMQQVARAARGLLPGLKDIRTTIQSKFWDGLAAPMEKLANSYFPIARYQGGKLAETFNAMAKELAGFLSKSSTVNDLDGALTNVNTGWRAMVAAVQPLAGVFTDLVAVSSEFLPKLGKGIAGAAQGFADFIHGARESGKLKEWIQGGLDALKQLGAVLVNVGRIIGAVFRAGQDVGGGFLGTLQKITDKMADFLESAQGQSALRTLFDSVGKAVDAVMPVVKALAKALVGILPILVTMGEHLGPGVTDLINGLSKAIQGAKPFFIALADSVSDLFSAIGNAGPLLQAVVEGLVWAATPLGVLADVIRFIAKAFDALPQPLKDASGLIIGIGLVALTSAGLLGKLASAVTGMAATVGKGLGVLGKIPGLGVVGKAGDKLQGKGAQAASVGAEALGGAAGGADAAGKSTAAKFMSALGRGIAGGAKYVGGAMKGLFTNLGSMAGTAATGIAAAFQWAKPGLAAVISGIGSAIGVLGTGLKALGAALIANPIILIVTAIAAVALLIILNWDTVKVWLAAFWEWLQWLFGVIWAFVVQVWGAISNFFVGVWAGIVNIFTTSLNWIVNLWNTVWGAISDFFVMIWGAITGAASAAWNGILSVASTVWNAITGAISAAINAVSNVISGALGGIKSAWDAAWGWVSDLVTGVWNGITSVVSGAVGVVKDIIGGLVDFFKWCWDRIQEFIGWIGDAVSGVGDVIGNVGHALNPANWFAKGGLVGGRGNEDSEHIMATPGEYVVPKKVVPKWLPLLRAINPYDHGSLMDVSGVLANVAPTAPQFAGAAAFAPSAADGGGHGGTTVVVNMDVKNPLPEKASVSASKRVGQAARIGVATAIGGAA